jgi:hypothetical protein
MQFNIIISINIYTDKLYGVGGNFSFTNYLAILAAFPVA